MGIKVWVHSECSQMTDIMGISSHEKGATINIGVDFSGAGAAPE